jgi:hypothetical protein
MRCYRSVYPSSGMDPTRSDPIPKLTDLLPKWTRPYPTRYRSLYIIFRCGSYPIRTEAGACASSTRLYPIRSDPMPKLIHPLPEWIRSYPIRYHSLCPIRPEWIRPDPIPYRSLHIFFRKGPDPIRPDTGAYTLSSGADPILSEPKPELVPILPDCIRSDPIRCRSLYILSRNGSDPIRTDTTAYVPFVRNGSDPIRSHTEAYTYSSEMDPTLSDPIPELIHYLPVRIRSYPIRSRSLYIVYQSVSDPIPSDTGVCTLSSEGIRSYPIRYRSLCTLFRNGSDPIRSDTGLETEWIRPDPLRSRILYILFRNGPDTIRPVTGAYALSSGVEPILSDPIPEFAHYLPEWTRSYPTRYRSLYSIFRCGTDPIRSDTGACASSTGMNPILSDPVPELIPYIPVWNRSYPVRYRSLDILYPNSSDHIRPDTGAYTSLSGMDPVQYRRFDTLFRNGSDPL